MVESFWIERSRAVEPLFYKAPVPEYLPRGMKPLEFQFAGVEYCLARDHALIGDEPGLTKTAQSIMIGNAIEAKHTLVVCPASLRLNWEREIWAWSTMENVHVYPVLKGNDGISLETDYTVVSYDLLRNDGVMAALLDTHWDHLILDEAHYIKDPKGNKRTRAICAPDMLPSVVGRMTALSGTILPNQPIECLGANTLVLTNRGWSAIVDVLETDLLWDGGQWVTHCGLTYRGVKKTIDLAGVSVTPDHILLSGDQWHPAASLAQNDSILSLALGTALENLPFWAWIEGHEVGSWLSSSSVTVERYRIRQILGILGGVSTDAVAAVRAKVRVVIRTCARTLVNVRDFCRSFKTLSSDARTPATPTIVAMEDGASTCVMSGSITGERSWPTSPHSLSGISRGYNWIVETMRKVMSRVTSVGSPEKSTWGTDAPSMICKSASTRWKPVYDLVNAGPRRRFTIKTDRGPVIAHNCYNLFRLMNWEAIDCMSLEAFRNTYYEEGGGMVRAPVWDEKLRANISKLHWSDKVRNVPCNLEDLQNRLREHLMVRRLQPQVLHELPPMWWHPFPIQTTAAIRKALKHPGWKKVEKLYDLDPEAFNSGVPIDGAVSTARRELGEAKAPAVADYIDDILDGGIRKLVVAAWHRSVLDYFRERLSKHGLVYMDGRTSTVKKQAAVDAFQTREDVVIILGQTLVVGQGWTLTAAQDIVMAEPDWVPGSNNQLLRRISRLGQTGNRCVGHMPIVPGTLDERIISNVVTKDQNIYVALDKTL